MNLADFCNAARIAYLAVLGLLCIYGLHRCFLVWTFYRVHRRPHLAAGQFTELPKITVQLPMFNESEVAERVIEKACALDYPADRLQIQVLDDSTDSTQEIARAAVARMRAAGHDVVYRHRTHRTGFKAGALEEGLREASGEFVAIFDADFLPPPSILRDTIDHFVDPKIGMVQTRWDHLNRDASALTRAQAILLDGHFVIEHTARNRSGRYMSFNGTAGIWRRKTIEEAGGWQHDTLTEDLDLSYRAQLAGWQFVFKPQIAAPAELPPEMNAFKAQQHRWTKGGVQTCLKLLPRVFNEAPSWPIKLEAWFHLTSGLVYVLMVLLTLLLGPALLANLLRPIDSIYYTIFEGLLFTVGFGSATAFYFVSQRELNRSWWSIISTLPALLAVGTGIAFNNAIATIEGLFGKTGEFVRTPKFGAAANRPTVAARAASRGLRGRKRWQAWAELIIAFYLATWLFMLIGLDGWVQRVAMAIPFVLIFIAGYLYVALDTFAAAWAPNKPLPAAVPAPVVA